MTPQEMLEIYKKHERNTRQDLAALITIAEILGVVHEEMSNRFSVLNCEIYKIRKALEESL